MSYETEYRTLYQDYIGLVITHTGPNRFLMGISAPNAIEGEISFARGALITFNASSSVSFTANISLSTSPVEYHLWPQMPQNPYVSVIKPIVLGNGTFVLTAPVTDDKVATVVPAGATIWYNGTGSALRLSGAGSVVIYGSLIYPQRLILKGSNAPSSWSTLQAKFDALDEFIQDGQGIFNTSEVQEIQTSIRVPLLLELIGGRIADGTYSGNPSLFTADFNELSKYATPTTTQQILSDYYNSQKVQPAPPYAPLTDVVYNPFFLNAVVPFLVAVFSFLLGRRYGRRNQLD